jgi:hypothetical protein
MVVTAQVIQPTMTLMDMVVMMTVVMVTMVNVEVQAGGPEDRNAAISGSGDEEDDGDDSAGS